MEWCESAGWVFIIIGCSSCAFSVLHVASRTELRLPKPMTALNIAFVVLLVYVFLTYGATLIAVCSM